MEFSAEDLALLKNLKKNKRQEAVKPEKVKEVPVQFELETKNPPPKPVRQRATPQRRIENHEYDDLDSVTVSMDAKPKVWKDADLANVSVMDIARLTPVNAILVGKEIMEAIHDLTFTARHAELTLTLAASMYKLDVDMENPIFLLNKPAAGYGRPISVAASASASVGAKVDAKLTRQLNSTRTLIKKTTDEAKLLELQVLETKILQKMEANIATNTEMDSADNYEDAAAWAYFGAYIMRLTAKTEEAWVERVNTAVVRFKTWYDSETEVLDDLEITIEMAKKIRESFTKRPECMSTWVLWVAYNENENRNLTVNESGMMKYLAIQMFSYTGLHAYSFIAQIQIEHNITFKELLKQLHCAHTKKAVREVANIIRNYEVTEASEDRKTYFRYARVWNTGYFLTLQTNNCKMLAYVAAKTKKMLSSSTAGSDPTKVYALKNLDIKMKNTLDVVADNLYDFIMEASTQDETAGKIWITK